MSEDLQLRQKCQEFLDGDLRQDEFVGWFIEYAAWNWSTTFWCHVMRMKSKHDHIGDHIQTTRFGGDSDGE